jgi:hypothetical protein
LDIIGGDKIEALSFFPGMNLPTGKKVDVFRYVLTQLKKNFNIEPMNGFSISYEKRELKIRLVQKQ